MRAIRTPSVAVMAGSLSQRRSAEIRYWPALGLLPEKWRERVGIEPTEAAEGTSQRF